MMMAIRKNIAVLLLAFITAAYFSTAHLGLNAVYGEELAPETSEQSIGGSPLGEPIPFELGEAPIVLADDYANIILGADNTMEYSTDGGAEYQPYDYADCPVFSGNVSVMVRYAATEENGGQPSGAAVLTFTENPESMGIFEYDFDNCEIEELVKHFTKLRLVARYDPLDETNIAGFWYFFDTELTGKTDGQRNTLFSFPASKGVIAIRQKLLFTGSSTDFELTVSLRGSSSQLTTLTVIKENSYGQLFKDHEWHEVLYLVDTDNQVVDEYADGVFIRTTKNSAVDSSVGLRSLEYRVQGNSTTPTQLWMDDVSVYRYAPDFSGLNSAVAESGTALGSAVAGKEPGNYPNQAIDNFKDAVEAAKLVLFKTRASQGEIIDAELALTDAKLLFDQSRIITNDEAVEKDAEEIKIPAATKTSFELKTVGIYGSAITWSSSNNDVISKDGVVQRPKWHEEDTEVILTATIKKGTSEAVRSFSVIVTGTGREIDGRLFAVRELYFEDYEGKELETVYAVGDGWKSVVAEDPRGSGNCKKAEPSGPSQAADIKNEFALSKGNLLVSADVFLNGGIGQAYYINLYGNQSEKAGLTLKVAGDKVSVLSGSEIISFTPDNDFADNWQRVEFNINLSKASAGIFVNGVKKAGKENLSALTAISGTGFKAFSEAFDAQTDVYIDNLEVTELVDKQALSVKIKNADDRLKGLNTSDYVESGINSFKRALTDAQAVYLAENSNQIQVDNAAALLDDAYDYLVLKSKNKSGGMASSGGGTSYNTPVVAAPPANDAAQGAANFSDLQGHWASEDIEYLASKGKINGVGGGLFDPDSLITRAQFAVLISRILEIGAGGGIKFADINPGDWYEADIAAVAQTGIISGFEGKFRPNDPITRQESAKIMAGALRYKSLGDAAGEISFADSQSIDDWAYEDIKLVFSSGLMRGSDDNLFLPAEYATRAQAATILRRFLDIASAAGN